MPVFWYTTSTELHAVWDTWMIENYTRSSSDYTPLVKGMLQIIHNDTDQINYYLNNMDVVRWADESFSVVRNQCYVFNSTELLTKSVPVLGDWYYNHNIGTVFQRLTAAAVRLSKLLANIFGGSGHDAVQVLQKAVEERYKLKSVDFSKFATNKSKFDPSRHLKKKDKGN